METFAESTSSRARREETAVPKGNVPEPRPSRFFGPLPTRGVWTAVGLTRGQFFAILGVSIAMFVFLYGPIWLHTHDSHFARIVWSYLIIVPMVGWVLYRNGKARITSVLGASVVIGLVKLVVTAVILVLIGLVRS